MTMLRFLKMSLSNVHTQFSSLTPHLPFDRIPQKHTYTNGRFHPGCKCSMNRGIVLQSFLLYFVGLSQITEHHFADSNGAVLFSVILKRQQSCHDHTLPL